MASTGRFSASIRVSDVLLNDIIVEGLTISDEVLNLDETSNATKVPLPKISEFTVVIPLSSDLEPKSSKAEALTFFLTWYRKLKFATPTLATPLDESGNLVSLKFNWFVVTYKKGSDDLLSLTLNGVFPVGISIEDLTSPGSETVSITFSYDSFENITPKKSKQVVSENPVENLKSLLTKIKK
jgi:hypothetical protein